MAVEEIDISGEVDKAYNMIKEIIDITLHASQELPAPQESKPSTGSSGAGWRFARVIKQLFLNVNVPDFPLIFSLLKNW